MRARVKKIGLALLLAWLLVALASPLLTPAWSQSETYVVTYHPVHDLALDYSSTSNSTTAWLGGSNDRYAAVLKFNLTSFGLQPNKVVSAVLRVYVIDRSSSSSLEIKAYTLDDGWDETSTAAPLLDDYITSKVFDCVNCWQDFAITSYVRQELGGDKIVSIELRAEDSSGLLYKIALRGYENATLIPQLMIYYQPSTETTTQTVTETVTVTETQTITATETATVNTTVTDYVTETQTTTVTQTDTIYTTETAYTTQTVTTTQTITDVITETATTTVTQTEWANQTVTVTTTMTPTTTVTIWANETVTMTEYGNSTAPEIDYQALAESLMPIVLIVGVLGTLLSLLLQSTSFRRGD